MLICMTCYEIYRQNTLIPVDRAWVAHDCPKQSCSGNVVVIDELIAPTIILLNIKGYKTRFCCSSHWYNDPNNTDCYISFEKEYGFEHLPYGFTFDNDTRYHNIIRKNLRDHLDKYQDPFHFSLETAKDVYEWVQTLPEISNPEEEEE